MSNITTSQLSSALRAVQAVAETIRELGEVPSGTLYAHLSGKLDLRQYEQVIGILKRTGLVEETPAHLLRWNEPQKHQTTSPHE